MIQVLINSEEINWLKRHITTQYPPIRIDIRKEPIQCYNKKLLNHTYWPL